MRVFLGETSIWIRRPLLRNVGHHLSILFSRRILSSSLLSSSVFPLSHYRSWDFRLFLSLRVRKSELLVLQPSTLGFTPVSPSFLRPLHADWIRVNFSGSPAGKWQIMGLLSLHNHGESILTLNLLLICLLTYTLLALFLGIMINTEAKEKDLVCFERWGATDDGFSWLWVFSRLELCTPGLIHSLPPEIIGTKAVYLAFPYFLLLDWRYLFKILVTMGTRDTLNFLKWEIQEKFGSE